MFLFIFWFSGKYKCYALNMQAMSTNNTQDYKTKQRCSQAWLLGQLRFSKVYYTTTQAPTKTNVHDCERIVDFFNVFENHLLDNTTHITLYGVQSNEYLVYMRFNANCWFEALKQYQTWKWVSQLLLGKWKSIGGGT